MGELTPEEIREFEYLQRLRSDNRRPFLQYEWDRLHELAKKLHDNAGDPHEEKPVQK